MELVTVRELFKNREQYLDKKVTVGPVQALLAVAG